MSDKYFFDDTLGMSFYQWLLQATPTKAEWHKDALEHIETPWFKEVKASDIVGKEAVKKLLKEIR